MFQIGPSLREARIRRGLSAADVHKAIRIRERYLTALEEERWDMLPGDAYTKGFLRTYAEFLGLNGQLYIDEFNSRIAAHEEEPLVPESLKAGGRRSSILFRTIGAVILIGGVVAGLAAWAGSGKDRPHLAAAEAAPTIHRTHHVQQLAPASDVTKPVVPPAPTFTVIRAATDRSWLDVRIGGPNGREVFRGILEQGRTLRFGLAHPVWVRMGRPLALDIRVGKTAVGNLPASPANVLLTKRGADATP